MVNTSHIWGMVNDRKQHLRVLSSMRRPPSSPPARRRRRGLELAKADRVRERGLPLVELFFRGEAHRERLADRLGLIGSPFAQIWAP